MAAISVIAEEPIPANVPPRFAATVIKEGDRYLIQVPARPGQIYCLEVPDGAGGMTFAGVPGSAVYAQSDTVRWPLELSGAVVGAKEDGNSAGASAGASPPAAGGTVLLPLTIEVAESPGTHVRLLVGGANPWVAVAELAFPRVAYEGFADLPTATGLRCAALSTRVVTAPIGATEPGKAALTLEQQQEFDAIVAGLPQLIAAATLPSGLPPALGNGSPSPLSSSRYFRVAMYRVDTNGNGYLDADELASGMNPFARPGESGYVDASNAGGSNGGNGGGIAPIWDSDDDFSPDFEEIAAGTSPMFKYSAPVVLTSQALYRSAVFDSWGSWTETQVWYSGWRPDVGYWLDAIFSHPDPVPPLGTTPRAGSAFMSDFASGWNAFGLPDPMAGKGLPPQKMFEESSKGSWASFARNVDLLNGPLSGTAGNIRAFGYRYRLRGPSSSVPQMRQFLELTWTKTSGFVPNVGEEAAAAALMEEAPVSVEPVTLTIPPGELYSEPHDMVSQGPADPEMPHSQVGQYLKVVRLLPVEFKTYPDTEAGPDKAHKRNLPHLPGYDAYYSKEWGKCVSKVWETSHKINLIEYLIDADDPSKRTLFEQNLKWKVDGVEQTSHEVDYGSEPAEDKHAHRFVELLAKSGGGTIDRLIITVVPRSTKTKWDAWYPVEKTDVAWFAALPPMFSFIEIAVGADGLLPRPDRNFNPFFYAIPHSISTFYHPGASFEMRSFPTGDKNAHQVCYDSAGDLLLKGVKAGSADKVMSWAPPIQWSVEGHKNADVKPFVWAAQLDGNPVEGSGTPEYIDLNQPMLYEGWYIEKYLEVRPPVPNNKTRLNPGATP